MLLSSQPCRRYSLVSYIMDRLYEYLNQHEDGRLTTARLAAASCACIVVFVRKRRLPVSVVLWIISQLAHEQQRRSAPFYMTSCPCGLTHQACFMGALSHGTLKQVTTMATVARYHRSRRTPSICLACACVRQQRSRDGRCAQASYQYDTVLVLRISQAGVCGCGWGRRG